jgi:hypothetical protein
MGYQLEPLRVSVTDINFRLSVKALSPLQLPRPLTQYTHCNYRHSVEQSVTLAIITTEKGVSTRFASVELTVAELLELMKAGTEGKSATPLSSASFS